MVDRRPVAWVPLMGALVVGAVLAGMMGWRLNLQALEHRITEKRSALKKLTLSGGIPPNQEVMDYLSSREVSLEQRYQQWLKRVGVAPPAQTASTDPQLYFQERFHEVQRILERLAAARSVVTPELLGFPKELPPSDTVPRLLVQLSLIQGLAELIFEQGINSLTSLKIEDPETVPEGHEDGSFLVRLPVRVRVAASLPQLMKMLGALEHVNPLIDLRSLHVVTGTAAESLDVELLLARYLVTAPTQESSTAQEVEMPQAKRSTQRPASRASRKRDRKASPASSAEPETGMPASQEH